jgi:hypothetical protein
MLAKKAMNRPLGCSLNMRDPPWILVREQGRMDIETPDKTRPMEHMHGLRGYYKQPSGESQRNEAPAAISESPGFGRVPIESAPFLG